MAYLQNYKYDFFVSYAHRDIDKEAGDTPWTELVVRKLERFIRAADRYKSIECFFDEKSMERDKGITQNLRESLDQSALFVAVVSKKYLQSDYCMDELKHFRSGHRSLLKLGSTGIFVLLAEPIDANEWPVELKDEHGDRLYSTKLFDPKNPSLMIGMSGDDQKLNSLLSPVSVDISKRLSDLETLESEAPTVKTPQTGPSAAAPEESTRKDQKRIFLAYPAGESAFAQHEEIARSFHEAEFDVPQLRPDGLEEFESKETFRDHILKELGNSHAMVQILTNKNGQYGLALLQYNEAQKLQVPTVLWRPDDLDLSDIDGDRYPDYAKFAEEHFKSVLTGPPNKIVDEVKKQLKPETKAKRTKRFTGYESKPRVFIYSVDPQGYTFVRKELEPNFEDTIYHLGWKAWLPSADEGPAAMKNLVDELAEICDALIVVHSPRQEKEAVKVIDKFYFNFRRIHPDKEFYVGMIKDKKKEIANFDPGIQVFEYENKKVPDGLSDWLEEIAKERQDENKGLKLDSSD